MQVMASSTSKQLNLYVCVCACLCVCVARCVDGGMYVHVCVGYHISI